MSTTLSTTDESPFAALSALGIAFSPVGLAIPEGLPVEHWQTLMLALPKLNDTVKWALGDALNYGEARFGNKYTAAMDATGISVERLRNYAWIARKVELSLRNDKLSWSHHMEVADLPPAEQKEWLAYAVEKKLSTRELRSAIDAAEEEEKALAETKARRIAQPARVEMPEVEPELPEVEPELDFAPPLGKKSEDPAPAKPEGGRLLFQPLVPREPAPPRERTEPFSRPAPSTPAPEKFGTPQPPAPRTELLWRNVCRAVFNFVAGTKSLTYVFEIIEVRVDGGFAYDITNNGNTLGRRSSLAGAKARCEEYMAETLKKAEGK